MQLVIEQELVRGELPGSVYPYPFSSLALMFKAQFRTHVCCLAVRDGVKEDLAPLAFVLEAGTWISCCNAPTNMGV